jgi:hypothetical protein
MKDAGVSRERSLPPIGEAAAAPSPPEMGAIDGGRSPNAALRHAALVSVLDQLAAADYEIHHPDPSHPPTDRLPAEAGP